MKETKESNETLMKNARRKARKEKYIYVKNMLEKSGVGVKKNIMGKADGIITKIKKTGKDTFNIIRKNLE